MTGQQTPTPQMYPLPEIAGLKGLLKPVVPINKADYSTLSSEGGTLRGGWFISYNTVVIKWNDMGPL